MQHPPSSQPPPTAAQSETLQRLRQQQPRSSRNTTSNASNSSRDGAAQQLLNRLVSKDKDVHCLDTKAGMRIWWCVIIVAAMGFFFSMYILIGDVMAHNPDLFDFSVPVVHPSGQELDRRRGEAIDQLVKSRRDLDDMRVAAAETLEKFLWRDDTIFVSIASYRDVKCSVTVQDIFERAANPRRVFLGIIEQNEHGDPSCTPNEFHACLSDTFCPADNIRRRRVVSKNGRGPTFGRWVASLMYRGEKFFMMIDSHNRFKPNWDADVLAMYSVIPFDDANPKKKAVLSHYPLAWRKDTDFQRPSYVTVMCRAHFVQFGYVRMGGLNFANSKRPRKQPYTAAGFVFADARMIAEVPFDPFLDFLFDGEELLYTVRLYTHGWDSYAPSHNIVFHDYDRHTAPRFWHIQENRWGAKQTTSVQRVQWMLRIPRAQTGELYVPVDTTNAAITREHERYGLGRERSLESFWKMTKLDLVKKTETNAVCTQFM